MVDFASIRGLSDTIVERFDPDRIVLFGSHARGEADERSDVDLLVALPNVADPRRAAVEIRRALRGAGVPKDIIVVDSADLARRSGIPGDVVRAALREGKVLHER